MSGVLTRLHQDLFNCPDMPTSAAVIVDVSTGNRYDLTVLEAMAEDVIQIGGGGVRGQGVIYDVLKSEVPFTIVDGDQLEVGTPAVIYTIREAQHEDYNYLIRLELDPT